jgi:replicative superfamily II helicase
MIEPSTHKELKDPLLNAVVSLAIETARAGFGVLVFASSRAGCESHAKVISKAMANLDELDANIRFRRLELLSDLASLGTDMDPILEHTIPHGVVFHHAGLTIEERELVADAYDKGTVKVCVATCSLAAGINLPARRVILHSARMGRDFVGPSMLRQMRGRAGRKGKDEVGETYLCCKKSDLEHVAHLMHADLPDVTSRLNTDKRRMKRALLEVIAIRLATTRLSIYDYINKSLFRLFNSAEETEACVEASLASLQELGFLSYVEYESEYQVTLLGKAVVASSIDPDDGLFIYNELKGALKAFVMDGDMHVLYTFTPVQVTDTSVNWNTFRNEVQSLDESGHRVLRLLGLRAATILRMWAWLSAVPFLAPLMYTADPKARRFARRRRKRRRLPGAIDASTLPFSCGTCATKYRSTSWRRSMTCLEEPSRFWRSHRRRSRRA